MKQLKHFSTAVVALLLGVAASETLLLVAPEDYKQMALHNEIGESPGSSAVSTSVSEKLPSYQNRLRTATNDFQNLVTPISSNTVEDSVDSADKTLLENEPAFDLRKNEDFESKSEVLRLDSQQKRCFVDYQRHLEALLANSTTGSPAHKVSKHSLVQYGSEHRRDLHLFIKWTVSMN